MCVISMVIPSITNPASPNYIPWTPFTPTPAVASELFLVLQKLDALDKKLGFIDCKLDEITKQKFMRKVKRRAMSNPRKRVKGKK